ncbi:MAG: sulfite exporter TauE/SafE family protein [Acidobacteria bacterium]|nr:sulfite exporter TauE/SafE family protein [Acidobacteriota bacterium]
MLSPNISSLMSRRRVSICALCVMTMVLSLQTAAHPLGNFTFNHFVRVETGADRVKIRYVVDLAEVPSFQEAQKADTDQSGSLSESELAVYLDSVAQGYVNGLKLTADGTPVELKLADKQIGQTPGAAGLMTLRMTFDLTGDWAASGNSRLRIENTNLIERAGWREIVITPMNGVAVFDSTAYGSAITDELKAYPEDLLTAPLNESKAEWSVTRGAIPASAKPLTLRDGKPVAVVRDRFAELITVEKLTPTVILIGLLLAFVLGGAHAMSPGHGKTVVGAYLVGSRGTFKHAAFLGATVTITHTFGVFVLGLLTLFASRYVLPEKLYPVLSFVSGALVVIIGGGMFSKRLNTLIGLNHDHDHSHSHDHAHSHDEDSGHTHLPPDEITWRSLLALGVSGGIMPCPSALVLMLGAISLNRVGYGLILILIFSLGLASVLTAVGLAFVYGGKILDRAPGANRWMKILPVVSSAVITILGAAICYEALQQAGINLADFWRVELEEAKSLSAMAILGLGLVIGLRHALDTDHLAAVSTIVSERKNLFSSLLIGGLWGVGHTVSLLIAGIAVIFLNLKIEKYEKPLEFCVALMLIGLGLNVLVKLARGGKLHFHEHQHGGHHHVHPHIHDGKPEPEPHTHHGFNLSFRPMIIGMVHGLAGSAALMLVVLATIKSTPLAFAYIIIFGIGSIGGMMIMSLVLSLPLHLTAASFTRTNWAVRALSGVFSLGFGLFMAYEIGFVEGLFR